MIYISISYVLLGGGTNVAFFPNSIDITLILRIFGSLSPKINTLTASRLLKILEFSKFPILGENAKICSSNLLKFGQDPHIDKRNRSWKFERNPTLDWKLNFTFWQVAKFRKIAPCSWILMEFEGNVPNFTPLIFIEFFHTPLDFHSYSRTPYIHLNFRTHYLHLDFSHLLFPPKFFTDKVHNRQTQFEIT